MAKLSQDLDWLLRGLRTKDLWSRLLENDYVWSHCGNAIRNADLVDLENAYQSLINPDLHACIKPVHAGSDIAGLVDSLRFTIACAGVACCCDNPNQFGDEDIWKWAYRTIGKDEHKNHHPFDRTTPPTQRASAAFDSLPNPDSNRAFVAADLTCQLLGKSRDAIRPLKIPILLIRNGVGEVAKLVLQKVTNGKGRLYLAPEKGMIEIAKETLDGFNAVANSTYTRLDSSHDVRFWLEGTKNIQGRSAEGALAVGLLLLGKANPYYDPQCVISATYDDGHLGHVEGITDLAGAKLDAAVKLVGISRAKVIVSLRSHLSDTDRDAWRDKGIDVVACNSVEDVIVHVSGELTELTTFIQQHRDGVLRDISERLKVPDLDSVALEGIFVTPRIALGARPVLTEDEMAILQGSPSESPGVDEFETSPLAREIEYWDSFRKRFHRAIVAGDPGFGKTLLLRREAVLRCDEAIQSAGAQEVPNQIQFAIFLPCSSISAEVQGVNIDAELFAVCLRKTHSFSDGIARIIRNSVESGRCMVLIDALDEITDATHVVTFLKKFALQFPKARLCVSTRRTGYDGPPFDVEQNEEVELENFDDDQVEQAVTKWLADFPGRAGQVLVQIRRSPTVCSLLRSPLLLHMACTSENARSDEDLPLWDQLTDLYDGFMDDAIKKLHARRALSAMEAVAFRKFVSELAFQLWSRDSSRTIWTQEDLYELIDDTAQNHLSLTNRLPHLMDDLQDSGLMVPVNKSTSLGNDSMMFVHRTISEYLVGKAQARRLEKKTDVASWKQFERLVWSADCQQVVVFCIGCYSDPNSIIARLADPTANESNPVGDDIFRHRLVTAASALSELKQRLIAPELAGDIAVQVWECAATSRMRNRIPPQIVPAFKALAIVNPMIGNQSFRQRCAQHYLRIVGSIPEIGPLINSPELQEQLLERLNNPNGVIRTISRIMPRDVEAIRAWMGINGDMNIDDLVLALNPVEVKNEIKFWTVIAEAFRFCMGSGRITLSLSSDFVERLETAIFDRDVEISRAASQVCRYLPRSDQALVLDSSLVRRCQRLSESGQTPRYERNLAESVLRNLRVSTGERLIPQHQTGRPNFLGHDFLTGLITRCEDPKKIDAAKNDLLDAFRDLRRYPGIEIRTMLPLMDELAAKFAGDKRISGIHDEELIRVLFHSDDIIDQRVAKLFIQLTFCFRLTSSFADTVQELFSESKSAYDVISALSFDPAIFGTNNSSQSSRELTEEILWQFRSNAALVEFFEEPRRQTLRFAARVFGDTEHLREVLLRAIQSPDEGLRREAMRIVSEFKIELDQRFVQPLVSQVSKSHRVSNSEVFRAITHLPSDVFDKDLARQIVEQYSSNRSTIDVERACRLVHLKSDLCYLPLKEVFSDPQKVTPLAAVLLARCGDLIINDDLVYIGRDFGDENSDVGVFYVGLLGNSIPFCSSDIRPTLLIEYARVRGASARRVSRPWIFLEDVDDEFFEWLLSCLASSEDELRDAAAVLCNDLLSGPQFDERETVLTKLVGVPGAGQFIAEYMSREMADSPRSLPNLLANIRLGDSSQLTQGLASQGYRFFGGENGIVCRHLSELSRWF